jgi:hypothetical protein
VTAPDLVIALYFVYCALAAWLVRLPARRRVAVTLASAAGLAFAAVPPADEPLMRLGRDLLPSLAILYGYRVSGLLFTAPDTRLEAALLGTDRWVFERFDLNRRILRAPRIVLEALEGAYVLCYPLVPAGVAVLYLSGRSDRVLDYWTIVLPAELLSYAMLPWLRSRPPRAVEGISAMDRRAPLLRRLNGAILRHGSVQVNTVPSGHAAGALAIALALLSSSPLAGLAFLAIATGIMAGSIAGRYHYAIDAASGAALAVACWAIWFVLRPA